MIRRLAIASFVFAALAVHAGSARADCTTASGHIAGPGEFLYNVDYGVMQYCAGTVWRGVGGAAGTDGPLANLTDVDDALAPADGECLVYNNATTQWETGACGSGGGASNLADLGDVDATGMTGGECLVYNNGTGNWEDGACNVLTDPPICTGANAALQWDGTSWGCITISGSGGGPTIVNGDHTQQECIDAGGTINTSDFGGDILCLFSGASCPPGWTSYGQWYRSSKTCTGNTSCLPSTGRDCTLPAGWVTSTGARSCTYKPSYPTCNGTCTQASGVGITTAACY